MSHIPPNQPYYGYPPPSMPPGYTYVPTPVMMPAYPPPPNDINNQPTYVTNHIYHPPVQVSEVEPTPVMVVENSPQEVIDWAPATTSTANSLMTQAYYAGREGWDGSPLWVIRAHHNGNLVPGKLAIHHKAAYIPFAGLEVPVHNFEVLCAQQNAVQWIPANNGSVPPQAIIAGNTHSAEPLYIGRVRHRGSLTPGKVHPSHNCCYISFGGSETSYRQYEVLCRV
ncbi:uncharacterized protein LOC121725282 [Aricia agestis]|uniref:uncharacterized protein LOC121725282 n=1 Tax=Aricia agestis TaxID=91739 RepID=UPI001C2055FD|nr:uncharacterized protein LOC121725282 [Aricia agestis]